MAYQLKTTGIAANCTMCIAVDPDTSTIKDFASSAVTADMTVGANVTIATQAWDGITRSYFRLGSGTAAADFVAFGANKPNFLFNASGQTRTVVAIAEVAGAQMRVFGADSSLYFASQNTGAGGATFPAFVATSSISGGGSALSSGAKRIFGFSLVHSTSSNYFYAADTDSAMTTGSVASMTPTSNVSLGYVGRRNDSTTHQQDKIHAVLIFNTALSQAQWDTLRDDWFGTLLEAASSSSSGTIAATDATDTVAVTGSTPGVIAVTDSSDVAAVTGSTPAIGSASVTDATDSVSVTGSVGASNNIRLQPGLYLERGGYAVSLSGLRWRVFLPSHGAISASGTGLTTNASGQATIDLNASAFVVGDWVELQILDYNAAAAAADRTVLAFSGFVQAIAQT